MTSVFNGLTAGSIRRVTALLGAAAIASAFLAAGTDAAAAPAGRGEKAAPARMAATPKVRRQGTLPLSNGTAYDLDSLVPGWDSSSGKPWVAQNIMYAATGDNGLPVLDIAGAPATDVLMGTRGPWNYQSCATAHYDFSYVNNPNVAAGSALSPGHGICVITRNTKQPLKTDGGHYVLLVVKARTNTTLTLQITVWQ
jgi:hypothetical protein